MLDEHHYHVYIVSSRSRAIYIGVTSDLIQRVAGHTRRYRITRLVYFEATNDITAAITREKQLKGWRREEKVRLIESSNPTWEDLAEGWFSGSSPHGCLRSSSQGERHS